MRVVFRVDASSQIGIGHVMRCLTLASELKHHGVEVSFVCRNLVGDMNEYILSKGFGVQGIDVPNKDWVKDASLTKKYMLSLQDCDWLIVDHYQLDKSWEEGMYSVAKRLMVIDDLANREHICNFLLDQNFYWNMDSRYEGLVPNECKTLLGPVNALLRKEFYEQAHNLRVRDGSISNVLIAFGGGDEENLTAKAIDSISKFKIGLKADVVVGSSNPFRADIQDMCKRLNFSFHCQTERMAELINRADVCLGAGGATTWERAVLGLPSIVIVCADNQLHTTVDMAHIHACIYAGLAKDIDEPCLINALDELIECPKSVKDLSDNMRKVMDNIKNRVESTAVEYLLSSQKDDT